MVESFAESHKPRLEKVEGELKDTGKGKEGRKLAGLKGGSGS